MEQDEKWQTGHKYFDMDIFYNSLEENLKEITAA